MFEAALWGAIGGSSLLIGALASILIHIPPRAIGLIMDFGAGVLISALAFELTEAAYELGGAASVSLGLAAGALAFFLGDAALDGRGGDRRKCCSAQPDGAPTALLLGAVLDGIPESVVVGTTLLMGQGISLPVLGAVFLSNLPEALAASTGMRRSGHTAPWVIGVWSAVVVVCSVASALGYVLLQDASGNTLGFIQSFAAGAVLTMLADTMIPEAIEHGGKAAGLVTVLGFAAAFLLSMLE